MGEMKVPARGIVAEARPWHGAPGPAPLAEVAETAKGARDAPPLSLLILGPLRSCAGHARDASVQQAVGLECARCGTALPPAASFCAWCGQRVGASVASPPSAGPERLLLKESAIAYRGWFDGVRMSLPFAGTTGYLALTSHRLVFVRGTVRGKFSTLGEMDAALARRGGMSFPLRDIRETESDNVVGAAIGGAYARLAVRVDGSTGPEAHTFAVHALVPGYLGMDMWVLAIDTARRNGGFVPTP